MDTRLHDFKGLKATGVADAQGDKGFDHESLPTSSNIIHMA
jgi:tRNA 2-thiocytidine biosynthesis protein TtcA